MDLNKKASLLFKKGKVKIDFMSKNRIFFIVESNKKHSVIFDFERGWSCDCEYFSLKGKECSHIKACKIFLINKILNKIEKRDEK